MAELTMNTPVADALNSSVQVKLVELGWSTGGIDDSAPLAEYILLMLINGKTKEQIASELANDLLNLGPEDTGAADFSQWLFAELERLNAQLNQGAAAANQQPQAISSMGDQDMTSGQDVSMDTAQDGSVPTGPKSMRGRGGGPGGRGRIVGQINRTLERPNDSVLHRTRNNMGNDRGNNMKSTRTNNRNNRGGMNRPMGMGMGMGMGPGPGGPPNMMSMNAQQQMQMMAAMLEEQSRMMAQMMPGMVQPAINPNFQNGQGQNGRSLMDRVQRNGQNRRNQTGFNQNKHNNTNKNADVDMDVDTKNDGDPSSSMEVESSSQKTNLDPANTLCRFNKRCTNKDCSFAHQSPAAPEGTHVDVTDTCSFGAACKNHRCTGKHPSPAQKTVHQSEEMCRFYPNCTNPHCHFKHPTMPLCRNGGDCKTTNCKFTHLQTACRFNPCLNRNCPYKHVDGQRGAFPDKVWTADGSGQGHLSERKFTAEEDGDEELIKPDPETAAAQEAELIA